MMAVLAILETFLRKTISNEKSAKHDSYKKGSPLFK